jgi:hypothetical protein
MLRPEHRHDRVRTQLRGVKRCGRQTTESVRNPLWGNTARLRRCLANQQIGQCRACGNRRHAPLRLKARRDDAAVFHAHRKPQNIAANGIGYLRARARIREISRIARAAKMFEHRFAEHYIRAPIGVNAMYRSQ